MGKVITYNQFSECDCCDKFDMNSLNIFSLLEHPIYTNLEKGEDYSLVYISPKEYLENCAKFSSYKVSYEQYISSNAVSVDKYLKYASDMENGDKFPIPYYSIDGRQEGRHRALAAMKIGCTKIPVVKIGSVSSSEIIDIYNSLKDKTREELDSIYIKKGYGKISDLDWRTIQTYGYRL